jgi:hypothetical protein
MAVWYSPWLLAASAYVLSDTYKVLPDGTLLELDRKPPGKLREQNAVWNAAKKELALAGAKNEVVACQIVIDGPAENVAFACTGLKGAGSLPAEAVSFHLVGYVLYDNPKEQAMKGYYPDVVVPLAWEGVSPISIPCKTKGLTAPPDQKAGAVMVEVKIPKDAAPGDYAGSIQLSGGVVETLNLKLTVWDFALPSAPTVLFDFNCYDGTPTDIPTDQRKPWLALPPEYLQEEQEYYKCANRHRAYLNVNLYKCPRGRGLATPDLKGSGKDVRCDWTHFDKRFGPVLSGELFEDKEPVPNFALGFNLHWPYGYSHDPKETDQRLNWLQGEPEVKDKWASSVNWKNAGENRRDCSLLIKKTPAYLEEWDAVAKQSIEHFAAKAWTKPKYQVYLVLGPDVRDKSPWRLDECYNIWDFKAHNYYGELAKRTFQNDKGLNFRYRIDIGNFYPNSPTFQDPKKRFKLYDLTPEQGGGGRELLEPVVDQFYVVCHAFFGNRQKVAEVGSRDANKEMFAYQGGTILDLAAQHRALPLHLYDYQGRGFMAWNSGFNVDPAAAIKEPNPGNDHVWYAAKKGLGFKGPAPSLRMKLWRRGSFDVEYAVLAAKKSSREKAMEVLNKNILDYKKDPVSSYEVVEWPYPCNNPEDYELARLKLASIILGLDLTGGRKFEGRIPVQAQPWVRAWVKDMDG